MAKCPGCNLFCSYDDPQVEINGEDVADNEVQLSVRIVLVSACCGDEVKDAEIETTIPIEHQCDVSDHFTPLDDDGERQVCKHCGAEVTNETADEHMCDGLPACEFESLGFDGEGDSRQEMTYTDRKGKVKKLRFPRTFYGASLSGMVKCLRCGEQIELTESVEEQASAFNELY